MYITRYNTFINSKEHLHVRHRGFKSQHIDLGDAVQCLCLKGVRYRMQMWLPQPYFHQEPPAFWKKLFLVSFLPVRSFCSKTLALAFSENFHPFRQCEYQIHFDSQVPEVSYIRNPKCELPYVWG
jgi:hypothetical protein